MAIRGAKRKERVHKSKGKEVASSVLGVNEDNEYEKFVSPKARTECEQVWSKGALHVEWHTTIEDFQQISWYEKLKERGWLGITKVPGVAVHQIVYEFYANLTVDERHCIAWVRGKQFFFNPRKFSNMLSLPESVKKPSYEFKSFGTSEVDVVWPD